MTFHNPLAFMKRREFDLTIGGQAMTGYAIDLEELDQLGERYPWFGKQMKGEQVEVGTVLQTEMLKVASSVIAASLAPDAVGDQRRTVEASARNIDPAERADLMRTVLVESFPQLADALSAEGNGSTPPKANRQQRRAGRSTGGGEKPRT